MTLKKYFFDDEIKVASLIIEDFHGKMLLDPSIKNPSAVVLSTYMACNESKDPMIEKTRVKELFISLGRKPEEFDKALYEISGKRKGKERLIDLDNEKMGLNFNGLKKARGILKENE